MGRAARLAQIARVVGRYRLDMLIPEGRIPDALHLGLRLNPWRASGEPGPPGDRLRQALEELGPVFIKFGQLLSTRRDLLPASYADALAKLQDQVAPFAAEEAVAIIEGELGQSVDELFERFDRKPLASASVAQVHGARLRDGREVVVKVVRPGIEETIRQDIALMYSLARLIERFAPDGRRLRPVEVVADYELTILDELDLGREAANTSQLRRNFEDGRVLYVPEVWWPGTRRRVLTMERIYGVPVTNLDQLRERGVDLGTLARRGVEIFFTQVLRDSFFHADMHPGNIFVDADKPDDPRYIAIDCAIIGSLSESDQYYLARNLLAIFQRDYREVARLHVECGWVAPETRIQDFEATMRAVCEPIFERPISEISFGQLLIYLFRTARRFDMKVQPSLILLQKTLLNIEGLGRQLYPELNLWETALPFLEDWMQQRYAPQQVLRRLQREAPGWLEQLPAVPELVLESLRHGRERDWHDARRHSQRGREALQRSRRIWCAAVAAIAAAFVSLPAPPLAAAVPAGALLAGALVLLWPRTS